MMFRAVLFDLDCTLTDRCASVRAAAELLARRYALPKDCTPQRLGDVMVCADRWGYRDRREFFADVTLAIGWLEAPPMRELLRFWSEDHPLCAVPAPGARELLRELRSAGMRLAIVTNGDTATQSAKIRQLRLGELVDSIVISGALRIHKPNREIFDHTLLRLGVEAREALFVGDHPINDMAGAHGAGIRGAWISGTMEYPEDQVRPWRTITQVAQVGAIMNERETPTLQRA